MSKKKKSRPQAGTVRRLPSGRYQAFVKHNGEILRPDGTFLYEHEAIAWAAAVKSELLSGITPKESKKPGAHMQFGRYFREEFTATRTYRGAPLKPGTIALHNKLYRNHLSYFSQVSLEDVTYEMVMKWYRALADTGHLTTASKAYKLLKAVFKLAVDQELIAKSPCRVAGAGTAETGVKQYQPTPSDITALAEAITPNLKAFVLFGAYSGLRFGELAALLREDLVFQVDDFGVQRWFVKVTKAVSIIEGKQVLGAPKSKKGVRTIALGAAANDFVAEHLGSMTDKSSKAILFPNSQGGMLRHDAFMKRWNVALKRIGLADQGFTPHGLRRYAATQYANASETWKSYVSSLEIQQSSPLRVTFVLQTEPRCWLIKFQTFFRHAAISFANICKRWQSNTREGLINEFVIDRKVGIVKSESILMVAASK